MATISIKGRSMNLKATNILRVGATAAVVAVSAANLSACSQQQLAGFVTGRTPYHPNYWVIDADTSGSTTSQTHLNGPYEQEMMAALGQAARDQATVFASPIDGNAVADATWTIAGVSLHTTAGGGSVQLAEAARVQVAKGLRPQVRALLRSRPTNGSDILGALQRISQLGRDLSAGAPKTLVLLTDGAINLPQFGGYDIYTNPPDTPPKRHRLIAQFKHDGELPRLSGWNVYLGGIGIGIGDRTTAQATIALWEELVPAMGARLVQINPTLEFS
jgi:hypothetical protein